MNRPTYAFTAEQLLDLMDESGVEFAVIAAASLFGDYNDYTIRCLRRFKRLRGTVIVGPDASMYELEKMNAEGVCGIRLQLFDAELPDLDSFEYRRLFARLRDLDWHVHLLTSRPRLVEAVRRVSATGVRLVIDHFGLPPEGGLRLEEFAAMLEAVARGNTWVKLSAGFRQKERHEMLAHYAEAIDKTCDDRLLFATDAPFVGRESDVTYSQALEHFKIWVPDADRRARIGRTAYELYFDRDA
jgi:predicted TIM-barrel fold metal-dependent hydrolase